MVMYHYVRPFPETRFPDIKGMMQDHFVQQVSLLESRYEMASLPTCLDFLAGHYQPTRDLCLLTFDDGLREHYETVMPLLAEKHITGVFGLITGAITEKRVMPVHKSHFLTAELGFDEYARGFRTELKKRSAAQHDVDSSVAASTYRWDNPEVAAFKYLLNFLIQPSVKESILNDLFSTHLGNEAEFSEYLYLSWTEARTMQEAGMIMAGHSHGHQALATLTNQALLADIQTCTDLLRQELHEQPLWPFTYPYGKATSFNHAVIDCLQQARYPCAFSTLPGHNEPGQDLFKIKRLDPKDVT